MSEDSEKDSDVKMVISDSEVKENPTKTRPEL